MSNLGLKEIKSCALAKTKPLPTEAALVKEFTTDSAIHPVLFSLNCQIISDVEQDELGDITTFQGQVFKNREIKCYAEDKEKGRVR